MNRQMEEEEAQSQSAIENQRDSISLAFTITYSNERVINCAVYNKNKRSFYVTQFSDNQYFSCLEALLIQLNPKDFDTQFKVYFEKPQLITQSTKLDQLLEGIQTGKISPLKKKIDIQNSLNFLLIPPLSNYYMLTNSLPNMNILGRLISELKLESDQTNKHKMKLESININKFMKLDRAAICALQIFPKNQQKKIISSNQTLFDLLCKCKTSIGTRCLKRWMKQPLQDQNQIAKRLDFIQYFIKNPDMRNHIQNQVLNSVCDLEKLYFTFYKVASEKPCKTSMSDLIRILKIVKALEAFIEYLQQRDMTDWQKQNIYIPLAQNVEVLSRPVMMIEKNVVMDGKQSEYYIKPSTQQSLNQIVQQRKALLAQIQEEFESAKKELRIDMELIKAGSSNSGFMFEGPKEKVQDAVKSNRQYKQGTVRGKKMTFKSNKLGRLCGELSKLDQTYQQQQKVVIQKMFKAISTYYEILQKISQTLSSFDVFTSWSLFISSQSLLSWTRPTFGKDLIIKEVRHPCVNNCVPSDLSLAGTQKCAIITGPNMGGKSTFIRMIGIASYLAHIGFFVPAKSLTTPLIDAIITRVGASDAQLQGVSTFMNQMLQSSCALATSTRNSLVLIDELGRGTSTHEGFGIAWGICEYLHTKIGSYCLFATHFHELTRMGEQVEGVINLHASCEVTKDDILMNYKVLPGKARMSYGIQLIKSMKFPQKVIDFAQNFYEGLQNFQNHSPSKSKNKNSKKIHEIAYETKLKLIQQAEKMRSQGANNKVIANYVKSQLGL